MSGTRQQNEHVLLVEGAKSYPEALAAISEFRNAVVTQCQDAVNSQLAEVAKALDVAISRKDVRERRRPERLDTVNGPDGETASLGVVIRNDVQGWRLYYHLNWLNGSDLDVSASCRFLKNPIIAAKVCAALKKAKPKQPYLVEQEYEEVCLTRRIVPDDMAHLSMFFQDLIREWTRLFQCIGGVKRFKASGLKK